MSGYPKWIAAWKAGNAAAPLMRTAPSHWEWMRDCQGTGIPRRFAPGPVPDSVPAMVVSFRFDAATPWLWADRLATSVRAPLVTYNGYGHGAYDVNLGDNASPARREAAACVAAFVDRFLLTGKHTGDPRPVCRGETAPEPRQRAASTVSGQAI